MMTMQMHRMLYITTINERRFNQIPFLHHKHRRIREHFSIQRIEEIEVSIIEA
ncbi:hypothetical protein D3C86_2048060 [compost metagenome]